tara:strand:+ start:2529 stop:2900 length:372 start_codon:yes stop_codon:yes gene_type:complete
MEKLIKKIFLMIQDTRESGQKEYAREIDNAFANFERIGKNLDITREKVLLVYLLKHIDGICSYVEGHVSQREDIKGRLTDAIVYLCLLWGMTENPVYPGKSKYYFKRLKEVADFDLDKKDICV